MSASRPQAHIGLRQTICVAKLQRNSKQHNFFIVYLLNFNMGKIPIRSATVSPYSSSWEYHAPRRLIFDKYGLQRDCNCKMYRNCFCLLCDGREMAAFISVDWIPVGHGMTMFSRKMRTTILVAHLSATRIFDVQHHSENIIWYKKAHTYIMLSQMNFRFHCLIHYNCSTKYDYFCMQDYGLKMDWQ